MIHFAGERNFAIPLATAFAKLSDAAFLVACVPDAKIAEASADRAVWKLKPKLSFVTGTLDAVLAVTSREPEKLAAFHIATKAIGAGSAVTATLQFSEPAAGGTLVQWTADLMEVTGLLKMVPKGLLQGTAEKVIDDMWTAIAAKL
jgi:carbon monoxide dehydrogenase subunit G